MYNEPYLFPLDRFTPEKLSFAHRVLNIYLNANPMFLQKHKNVFIIIIIIIGNIFVNQLHDHRERYCFDPQSGVEQPARVVSVFSRSG